MMSEEQSQNIKMFGYMERRGKMTIRGRWKRRWCVLEGHLLLYYKSQTEYIKLSPCCGSLNISLVRKIQPNVGCLIHITTHSQIIILRTPNKEKQEEWFRALASVLMQNYHEGLMYNDSLFPTVSLHRKSERRKNRRSVRISMMDEHDHSHNPKFAIEEEKNNSTKLINTSDSTEETSSKQLLQNGPHKIINRCKSESNIKRSPTKSDFKEFQRSLSCGCIFTQLSKNQNITTKSICNDFDDQKKKRNYTVQWNDTENNTVSFVEGSKLVSAKNPKKRTKNRVVHRHSFGFLKKILTRRKSRRSRREALEQQNRALQDLTNCFITSLVAVTTSLNDEDSSEEITHIPDPPHESNKLNTTAEDTVVSTTNTNESMKIEESRSWTMIECDRTSPNKILPELPVKTKKTSLRYSWLKEESINVKSVSDNSQTILNPNAELDQLMSQLIDLNKEPQFLRNSMPPIDDRIPDYDIPRSHLSIISEILSEHTDTENSSTGSPDYKYHHLSSLDMDPDSLEMPWLSNDDLNNNRYWPAASGDHFFLKDNIASDNDDSFLDSLNTIMHLS